MTSSPPRLPLSRSALQRALTEGRGRAVLHLRAGGPLYGDLVRRVFLHETVFDPYFNAPRRAYVRDLWDAVPPTVRAGWRRRILRSLVVGADANDLGVRVAVLGALARRGDVAAREALRAGLARNLGEVWLGAEEWIALGGTAGLAHIACLVGGRLTADESWLGATWVQAAKRRFGAGPTSNALRQAARTSRAAAAFVRRVRAAHRPRRDSADPTKVPSFVAWLKGHGAAAGWSPYAWGRAASPEEIASAERHFVRTDDPDEVAQLGRLFRSRPLAGPVEALLRRTRSRDWLIAHWSEAAFVRIHHPRVRAHGLALLAQRRPDPWGMRCLRQNAEPRDLRAIRTALPRFVRPSPDTRHELSKDLSLLLERLDRRGDVDLWAWCHLQSPCALCRTSVVRALIRRRAAPRWLLEEWRYDADEDTRRMARKALRSARLRRRG